MKSFFSLLMLLSVSAFLSAQTLTVNYEGCSSLSVSFSGTVLSKVYQSTGTVWCPNVFALRDKAGTQMKGAKFFLEQKSGTNTYTMVQYQLVDATSATFDNIAPGTYRVHLFRRNSDNTPVFFPSTVCTTYPLGIKYTSDTEYFSADIEIGTPVPSNIIFPAPTGNPAKICYSAIDGPSDLLLLNGEASFGERAYFVAVFKDNLQGQQVGYASTGWVQGKISIVNLKKSLNMIFEPGYKYTVQLALSQLPCTGWVDAYQSFIIDGSCREEEENAVAEVKIFPNPTSGEISFEGLESFGASTVQLQITDLMGKLVKSEELQAPFSSVSLEDLAAGTYIAIFQSGDQRVIKKVVRQ